MTESENNTFNLNLFDDDFEKHTEKINEYYEYLETHDFIELDWKCPGRKTLQTKVEEKPTVFETPTKDTNSSKMEFDFEDEPSNSSVKFNTPNRAPKTTLSANKKKTVTTFNSVMEKIKKQHGTPK
ncbi:hypothetical protein PVAND_002630 [Polypedilum vanderplanki]|uniref:Uncharacterized protein n=1 Tax=Polypedilum vanderplanki TaxID=319348 RepID=A0A9J6BRY8_POLVA|nr:hypothetical protein PVAND_002630 [Polypedilum vanderplanki]